MKRVSFHTLGCKVNFAESSTLARLYEKEGFVRVDGRADEGNTGDAGNDDNADGDSNSGGNGRPSRIPAADLYIVNTCSVTAAADKKCRNLIARIHRRAPAAEIVAMGCYAQRAPDEVAALPGVGRVERRDFGRFCPAYSAGDRTRSFLKVQDGCDYLCSYCTIHSARGMSRNAPIADLVGQAREIAGRGVKEIVLTGVNTGDFGRTTGENFADLVRALDTVDGIERYRISSIEPNLLSGAIIDFCASSDKFQPHFHIPLQSGSDHILGLMHRRYTTAKFAGLIDRVREKMPDTFFGIDVIAGFPGETDAHFEETLRFLEHIRPAALHVFPYSVRPGTPAAGMPGKVPPKVAASRAATLGALGDRLLAEFTDRFRGTRALVLWESGREAEHKDGRMFGFTGNYIRVSAPFDPQKVNTVTDITI